MSMNTRQAAVVEPILSEQARGYSSPVMVAHRILPPVDIPNRSMRVIRFGKESWRVRDTRRAPGAETKRVEVGYASDPVALKQEALEGLVPDEQSQEASKVPGIDMGAEAVREVQDIIALGRECEVADLVRNQATYPAGHVETLAGSDKWTDPDSDPKAVIDELRATIRRKIGRKPNSLALGDVVFDALTRHPKIKEQFKYTSADSITEAMLARYLNLKEIIIGEAVFLPEAAEDDVEATDVWGSDAILFHKAEGSGFRVPSFGWNYRLKGYPLVEAPYYERNRKSWVYPVTEEHRPYVTGADAGALIKAAV